MDEGSGDNAADGGASPSCHRKSASSSDEEDDDAYQGDIETGDLEEERGEARHGVRVNIHPPSPPPGPPPEPQPSTSRAARALQERQARQDAEQAQGEDLGEGQFGGNPSPDMLERQRQQRQQPIIINGLNHNQAQAQHIYGLQNRQNHQSLQKRRIIGRPHQAIIKGVIVSFYIGWMVPRMVVLAYCGQLAVVSMAGKVHRERLERFHDNMAMASLVFYLAMSLASAEHYRAHIPIFILVYLTLLFGLTMAYNEWVNCLDTSDEELPDLASLSSLAYNEVVLNILNKPKKQSILKELAVIVLLLLVCIAPWIFHMVIYSSEEMSPESWKLIIDAGIIQLRMGVLAISGIHLFKLWLNRRLDRHRTNRRWIRQLNELAAQAQRTSGATLKMNMLPAV